MTNTNNIPGKAAAVLVLVTDQFHCKRLITAGGGLAAERGFILQVVNVASPGAERNPEAIEFLFQASREQDAAMTIHYSDRPEQFLGELIQRHQPAAVVTGLPGQGSRLLQQLWMRFPEVDFYMVDHDGSRRLVNLADRALAYEQLA